MSGRPRGRGVGDEVGRAVDGHEDEVGREGDQLVDDALGLADALEEEVSAVGEEAGEQGDDLGGVVEDGDLGQSFPLSRPRPVQTIQGLRQAAMLP